jgi:amino-acid N-acetyltransferase
MAIERANAADLSFVIDLLLRCELPVDGAEAHVDNMVVARTEGHVVGSAALEIYGTSALLRSVAVDASLRGTGVGRQLTEAALDLARARGVADLFLLTTTAEHFFPRFGFERIERDAVPADVRTSVEFTSACPASAIVLHKRLRIT